MLSLAGPEDASGEAGYFHFFDLNTFPGSNKFFWTSSEKRQRYTLVPQAGADASEEAGSEGERARDREEGGERERKKNEKTDII